ncbi:MAG: sugar phosphate isomerase/epimerase [Candidatus Bathyarchaeia archaeon]
MPITTVGINSYSYHNSFQSGRITLERLLDRVEELGLESVEWCHGPWFTPDSFNESEARRIKELADEKGIKCRIAGFAPLLAEGKRVEEMLKMVEIQLKATKIFDASVLRFDGMLCTETRINGPKPLDLCLRNLKRVVGMGERAKVIIALEDHMDFGLKDFKFFLNEIGSPYLKVTFDTGNLLPLLEDPLKFAEELLEDIVDVHFKGIEHIFTHCGALQTGCPPEHSVIDLNAILNILSRAPQEVSLHIEVMARDEKMEDGLVESYVKFLKMHLSKIS